MADNEQQPDHAPWLSTGRFEALTADEQAELENGLNQIRDRVIDGARIAPGQTILDVGSGDGRLALEAARRVGPAGRVIGVDVSPAAIELAIANASSAGLGDRLDFRLGSATDLPLESASVDVVVDRAVLIYVPDRERAVTEYRRVIRDGGRVSICEPVNSRCHESHGFDLGPIRDLHRRVIAARREEEKKSLNTLMTFDESALAKLLEAAGFGDVELALGDTVLRYESATVWRRRLAARPNPLSVPVGEIVTLALGNRTEEYLDYMGRGIDQGGMVYRCPVAYIGAIAARVPQEPGD